MFTSFYGAAVFSITAFSLMTLGISNIFAALSIKTHTIAGMLCVIMLSFTFFNLLCRVSLS
jgi:hypothetical protein